MERLSTFKIRSRQTRGFYLSQWAKTVVFACFAGLIFSFLKDAAIQISSYLVTISWLELFEKEGYDEKRR
jgi:hypothetical protein